MITWMQRHKKWLVITIWISTIAFVGAGFVGWGSYDYGKQGAVVAVVGDREVSVEEYQQEYYQWSSFENLILLQCSLWYQTPNKFFLLDWMQSYQSVKHKTPFLFH